VIRTLAIATVIGLVLGAAATASAIPVDHGREPARVTIKGGFRVATHVEKRAINRAKDLPHRRVRFAWRVGRHRPRYGFVCVKRRGHVYGIGVRRATAQSKRWRTWDMDVYAAQSYGQHCAQILSTRAG
jgi:hypothetical protein